MYSETLKTVRILIGIEIFYNFYILLTVFNENPCVLNGFHTVFNESFGGFHMGVSEVCVRARNAAANAMKQILTEPKRCRLT